MTYTLSEPWVHHCDKLRELYKAVAISLTIIGHDEFQLGTQITPTTTYSSLCGFPRSLPGSVFPFTTITFRNLRFSNTNDLYRIISQLPALRSCIAQDLTFERIDFRPDIMPRLRRPRRRLSEVKSWSCMVAQPLSERTRILDLELSSAVLIASACPTNDVDLWAHTVSLLPTLFAGLECHRGGLRLIDEGMLLAHLAHCGVNLDDQDIFTRAPSI